MYPSVFEIIFGLVVLVISLIVVFLLSTAILQKTKEQIALRAHRKRKKRRKKESHKKYKQERKEAPIKFNILMQPQNKNLFENFVHLLDDIDWPEYPEDFVDNKGETLFPSLEELEDYDEELEGAIDEENRMYALYLKHIQSKNVSINKSELSHVVDLYKMT